MKELDLMIQFRMLKNEIYVGSISLSLPDIFIPGGDFSQFLTVFDTFDDDEFDGDIGVDDEDTPKIKVGFNFRELGDDEEIDADEEQQEELSHSYEEQNQLRKQSGSGLEREHQTNQNRERIPPVEDIKITQRNNTQKQSQSREEPSKETIDQKNWIEKQMKQQYSPLQSKLEEDSSQEMMTVQSDRFQRDNRQWDQTGQQGLKEYQKKQKGGMGDSLNQRDFAGQRYHEDLNSEDESPDRNHQKNYNSEQVFSASKPPQESPDYLKYVDKLRKAEQDLRNSNKNLSNDESSLGELNVIEKTDDIVGDKVSFYTDVSSVMKDGHNASHFDSLYAHFNKQLDPREKYLGDTEIVQNQFNRPPKAQFHSIQQPSERRSLEMGQSANSKKYSTGSQDREDDLEQDNPRESYSSALYGKKSVTHKEAKSNLYATEDQYKTDSDYNRPEENYQTEDSRYSTKQKSASKSTDGFNPNAEDVFYPKSVRSSYAQDNSQSKDGANRSFDQHHDSKTFRRKTENLADQDKNKFETNSGQRSPVQPSKNFKERSSSSSSSSTERVSHKRPYTQPQLNKKIHNDRVNTQIPTTNDQVHTSQPRSPPKPPSNVGKNTSKEFITESTHKNAITTYQLLIKDMQDQLDSLNEENQKLVLDLDSSYSLNQQYELDIRQLSEKNQHLQEQIDTNASNKQNGDTALVVSLKKQLITLQEQLDNKDSLINNLNLEHTSKQRAFNVSQAEIEKTVAMKDFEIGNLQKKLSIIEKELGDRENIIDGKEKQNRSLKEELRALESQVVDLESSKKILEQSVSSLSKKQNSSSRNSLSAQSEKTTALETTIEQRQKEIVHLRNKFEASEDKRKELHANFMDSEMNWERKYSALSSKNTENLERISELSSRISDLEYQISEQKERVTRAKSEMSMYKEENDKLKQANTDRLQSGDDLEIEKLRSRIIIFQKERNAFGDENKMIKEKLEESRQSQRSLQLEIETLKKQLREAVTTSSNHKNNTLSISKPQKDGITSRDKSPINDKGSNHSQADLDKKITGLFKEYYPNCQFYKISNGVYSINGRRLICKMVNDLITVRMGGGYMPLSEYLKLYSPEDDDNEHPQAHNSEENSTAGDTTKRSSKSKISNTGLYTLSRKSIQNNTEKSRSKTPRNFKF